MGAKGIDDRVSAEAGNSEHATAGSECNHGAGRGDGWQKLADKFGRKKLAEDLAAAIRTAQDGFPVPDGRRLLGGRSGLPADR